MEAFPGKISSKQPAPYGHGKTVECVLKEAFVGRLVPLGPRPLFADPPHPVLISPNFLSEETGLIRSLPWTSKFCILGGFWGGHFWEHHVVFKLQKINANFFSAVFFKTPSGHGRPCWKSWTSVAKPAFWWEKLLAPGHPRISVGNVRRKFRPKVYVYVVFLPWVKAGGCRHIGCFPTQWNWSGSCAAIIPESTVTVAQQMHAAGCTNVSPAPITASRSRSILQTGACFCNTQTNWSTTSTGSGWSCPSLSLSHKNALSLSYTYLSLYIYIYMLWSYYLVQVWGF